MDHVPIIYKTETTIPSYLKHFESEYKKINLIYSKKPSIPSDSSTTEAMRDNSLNNSVEDCELTGDPLKVDLGHDDSIELIKVDEVAHNWSKDESKHFPLIVREARRVLNKTLKKTEISPVDVPTYVICDGKDPKRTILLGGYKKDFLDCRIEVLGLVSKNHTSVELENMVKQHLKSCNNNSKISYRTKMEYNLYGKSLKNLSCQTVLMRNLEQHAHASVTFTCNECIFSACDGRILNMMMNLELVAGHRLLSLNFLWEEMCLLQTYLDVLLDSEIPVNDETILCKNSWDPDEILRRIGKLVNTRFLRSSNENEVVDLKHLREGDFLDELWTILKNCENASVLRNSFHFLFEDVTETNNRSVMIKDKTSNIALLIDGILNGKLILSAITLPQAVELLFELGAYKLKHDFQAILKQFCASMKTNIDSLWKGFAQKSQLPQNNTRTTRVTQSLKNSQLDTKTKQLAYLSQLYVGAEFIYLVKDQVILQENAFYYLCEWVEKEFVANSKKFIDFLEIYQSPLCEISLQLDSKSINMVQSVLPSFWSMQMTSKVGNISVMTLYNLSESPVFPPSIYDYDVPVTDDDKMVYFASKMTRIKGLF